MQSQLEPICLLPPSLDTAWIGLAPPAATHSIKRRLGPSIELSSSLFWFDPPWYRLPCETADALAAAVSQCRISVSAMHRDLCLPNSHSRFEACVGGNTDNEFQSVKMLPYRPERYGLSLEDFDNSHVIDVRLSATRDESGAIVFSQSQIQRWEPLTDGQPVAGGSWVPAATFPPDVASIEKLGSKILQLRKLSPKAAVFVSLGPFRLEEELSRLIQSPTDTAEKPDGIIVRFNQASLTPIQLAEQTQRARTLLNKFKQDHLPLWIVPGDVSADDCAKLVGLGADGIAVDAWCQPLLEELAEQASGSAGGYSTKSAISISSESEYRQLYAWVDGVLASRVDRFFGLCRSLNPNPHQRLGTFDRNWASTLKINFLGAASA